MSTDIAARVRVKQLGCLSYEPLWREMQAFTDARDESSIDEIWLLQHDPVYTLGQAGKAEHLLSVGDIPVVKSDRGGQVTYHGPGQLIAYLMIDLRRRNLGVRRLVTQIEQALIDLLAEFGIEGRTREKAPGVYVNDHKIASLGLRVRKSCTYHGLSLNLDMDLDPFGGINVCGYKGLKVVQLGDLISEINEPYVRELLLKHLINRLGYSEIERVSED